MEDNVKSLAKVQINNIHCSPRIHQSSHFTIEGYHVCQPFAVPVEVLLVIFHFPKQIQFQVGFLNPISVLLDSVTIILPGHLSLLPLLYVPFLCLSLLRSSLFSCAGLLPPLCTSTCTCTCGWTIFGILENQPVLLGPSSFQDQMLWESFKQVH